MSELTVVLPPPGASHGGKRAARPASRVIAGILAALMMAASILAIGLRPKARPAGEPPRIVLEVAIPKQFGDWRVVPQAAQVVNPQTQELLDKLYSQTLSRTYANSKGYRVMLSLAYGNDQRGGLQAHMPEVCYPAQGFKLEETRDYVVKTSFGNIPGKRLMTTFGARREPITYWFAMGDRTVRTGWEKRVVELRLGLTGQIPEGLLFRMSSIDPDRVAAYVAHEAFAQDLLAALSAETRQKISGLAL